MTVTDKLTLTIAILQLLTLFAGVATVVVYFRQLKAMQGQLQTSLESSARSFHNELLKLSVADKDILEVWRAEFPGLSPEDYKRHLFANLSLSHLETLFQLGCLSEAQAEEEIKHHAGNPHYIAFWQRTREHRSRMLGSTSDKPAKFHGFCEQAFGAIKPNPAVEKDAPRPARLSP